MEILFLSQVLPYPLDAGPKTRAYYVLRHLAQHHSITLLTFIRHTDSESALTHLRTFCKNVYGVPIQRSRTRDARDLLRSFVSPQPFMVLRDWIPSMAQHIKSVLDTHKFHAIHADQLWMAPYALWAREITAKTRSDSKPPLAVLDQHNAVFQIPLRLAQHTRNPVKRWVLLWEAYKLQQYEHQVCNQFDQVVWVTQEDREALNKQTGYNGTQDLVIPICVEANQEEGSLINYSSQQFRITFMGGMHWPPNAEGITWFVNEVWPMVRGQLPNARLTIIGKQPPVQLRSVATNAMQRIDVLGYVDDPARYLSETAVFIVPLHAGGGMRVKILDAWRWHLPVVSTTIGAEGINVRSGENILLADTPAEFAAHICQLWKRPDLAQSITTHAYQTLIADYHWQTRYKTWDQVYQNIGH